VGTNVGADYPCRCGSGGRSLGNEAKRIACSCTVAWN